ncbi:MAG: flagellar basal body-associated FliL family protein [Microthrixaceae bacterium]
MSTTEAPTAPGDEATAADAPPEGDAKKGKKGKKGKKDKRSNVLPALIVAGGLVVGGFMMKPSAAPAAAAEAEEEEAPIPGELVALESMTLNLSDGRYLRLGVALELVEGVEAAEFEESGATNRFRDLIIDRVADLSADEVATPDGRDQLKSLLRDGGHELFEEEFFEIYLTELVVQ